MFLVFGTVSVCCYNYGIVLYCLTWLASLRSMRATVIYPFKCKTSINWSSIVEMMRVKLIK